MRGNGGWTFKNVQQNLALQAVIAICTFLTLTDFSAKTIVFHHKMCIIKKESPKLQLFNLTYNNRRRNEKGVRL